jgi:hypothetical protein
MKRFVLAVALTGLMSVAALAGEIPTNDSPSPTTTQSATVSTTLTNVVLTIITLIGR